MGEPPKLLSGRRMIGVDYGTGRSVLALFEGNPHGLTKFVSEYIPTGSETAGDSPPDGREQAGKSHPKAGYKRIVLSWPRNMGKTSTL